MSLKPTDFDATSPIFPANTQIDIVFKKRNTLNYLNYLHAFQIDPTWGANKKNITSDNHSTTLRIRTAAVSAVSAANVVSAAVSAVDYNITGVRINVKNMYLQVGTP
jgi:hypothetical protein